MTARSDRDPIVTDELRTCTFVFRLFALRSWVLGSASRAIGLVPPHRRPPPPRVRLNRINPFEKNLTEAIYGSTI